MKLILEKHPDLQEIEVTIKYGVQLEEAERLAQLLGEQTTLIGKKDDRNYPLEVTDIMYLESVDDKVFAYTSSDVYQIKQRLYELEQYLERYDFSRISISAIVNRRAIRHFKSSLNGRIEAKLANGEIVIVSRSYVKQLKTALGGDRK